MDKMLRFLLFILFNLCLMVEPVLSSHASSSLSMNDQPVLQLSVHPTHGISTKNIEVRCRITPSLSSPSAASNFENVYVSVKSDNVKPSGILLMVDNYANKCLINREKSLHSIICNRTHVLIRVNHTILNHTRHTIDYACTKGDIIARATYRIAADQRAHHSSSHYQDSSSLSATVALTSSTPLIVSVISIIRWMNVEKHR